MTDPWPIESRRRMMRDIVRLLNEKSVLRIENAAAISATYGLAQIEVEGEMMKYLQEGDGK